MTNIQLKNIVFELIKQKPASEKELFNLTRQLAGKNKQPSPEKSQLLAAYRQIIKKNQSLKDVNLEKFLTKRAVRTMSGVAVISVLTKPYPCPGNCLYCPTEKDMPKSYLSNEPAVMRAIGTKFDPFKQVQTRLKALAANGHSTEKIELIIMGGTWSYLSPTYQNNFIKKCFDALNGKESKNLAEAQKMNESAKHRCIGLTLETRPDYINEKEIVRMRKYGCTRVELGIQHIDDKILKLNRRGHNNATTVKAIKLLRQAGFKLNFHLMLNLPGSTPAKDFAMFKKIYQHPDYMPDMVKIYPCVVNEHADLYRLWQKGKYKSYTDKQLTALIVKIKKITPLYVRITRLIRDIPEESIISGNKITNLRQIISDRAKKENWSCQCIRCREAGHVPVTSSDPNLIKLSTLDYPTNGGHDYFISFESEDKKILYAFLRLRLNKKPENNFIPEIRDAALIRELHTYGQLTDLGQSGEVQHLGLGKKLLQVAEDIAKQNQFTKIAVISGIGVRKYYEKNGYTLQGNYMVKEL